MKFTVDRFEGGYAVLESEGRETFSVPARLLPAGTPEGAVIRIERDEQAEADARAKVRSLMDQVFKD